MIAIFSSPDDGQNPNGNPMRLQGLRVVRLQASSRPMRKVRRLKKADPTPPYLVEAFQTAVSRDRVLARLRRYAVSQGFVRDAEDLASQAWMAAFSVTARIRFEEEDDFFRYARKCLFRFGLARDVSPEGRFRRHLKRIFSPSSPDIGLRKWTDAEGPMVGLERQRGLPATSLEQAWRGAVNLGDFFDSPRGLFMGDVPKPGETIPGPADYTVDDLVLVFLEWHERPIRLDALTYLLARHACPLEVIVPTTPVPDPGRRSDDPVVFDEILDLLWETLLTLGDQQRSAVSLNLLREMVVALCPQARELCEVEVEVAGAEDATWDQILSVRSEVQEQIVDAAAKLGLFHLIPWPVFVRLLLPAPSAEPTGLPEKRLGFASLLAIMDPLDMPIPDIEIARVLGQTVNAVQANRSRGLDNWRARYRGL